MHVARVFSHVGYQKSAPFIFWFYLIALALAGAAHFLAVRLSSSEDRLVFPPASLRIDVSWCVFPVNADKKGLDWRRHPKPATTSFPQADLSLILL